MRMSGSLILVPAPGALFLLLGCLAQPGCDGFLFYLIMFYFVMFGCCLLEALSFLIRDRKVVDPDGRNWEE